MFCGTHLRPISQEALKISIGKIILKNKLLKLQLHLPGTNELMTWSYAFLPSYKVVVVLYQ